MNFSDVCQLWLIAIHTCLMTYGIAQLFYSERPGRYSDKRPPWRMTLVALPLVFFVHGPAMLALAITTAYQKLGVFWLVFAIHLKNRCMLFLEYTKTTEQCPQRRLDCTDLGATVTKRFLCINGCSKISWSACPAGAYIINLLRR
jgi:hypothetical protein